MKILYCNKYNFSFSGTEVYLFDLMELMRRQGHEVALFSMADQRGTSMPYDQHFVPHLDFKANGHGMWKQARLAAHAIYSTDARKRLRALIEEFRPEVAHVRNIYHHLSPSILWELKRQGVPVVYHLNDFKLLCPSYNMVAHGQACERCNGHQFWRVITEGCYHGPRGAAAVLAAEAYVHRWLQTYETCVDRFLAPSEFVKQKLVERGWDAGRITVLPHFQALPLERPAEPPPNARILYFGRLSAEKGVLDLLSALERIPQIRVQIAGDGPQRPELERVARSRNLNVEFVGYKSGAELQALIAASRFTVLPSRAYETLGKSILESYAQSRAVIASDLGSRREFVQDGVTGMLFEPGNVVRLAELLSFLYARPELSSKMGAAGHEFVRERCSPDAHSHALTELYEQLAGLRSRRVIRSKPGAQIKIAFIGGRGVASKYSGIESYYEEVGRRLVQMGHQVTVYCRTYFTPAVSEHNGMQVVRLPTIRSKHLDTVLHTLLSTIHVLFSDCNVVHYHALGPALFAFIPRMFGKRTVVTVQGLDWQRNKWGRLARTVLQWGERAAVRLPNATIVVSRTLDEYYRQTYAANTIFIPNGTLLRDQHVGRKLDEWGVESGNYVLFLGRFSPEKNCHLLVEAFENLETGAKLVLAGGSSYSDAYAQQLRTHQNGRIKILDWVSGDDLDELLTNAMLFVLPSDLEGLSLALLDAMAAGVCVLTSDVPENRELVDGVGFTFRRGNALDLERMLDFLSRHPVARESAAHAARERIREHYLWQQITSEVERVYWELMGWNKAVAENENESIAIETEVGAA